MAVTVSTLAMLRSSAKLAWNAARTKSPHQGSAAAVQATRAARRLGRGKDARPVERSPYFAQQAFQVAPHVAALRRVEVERRVVPALVLSARAGRRRNIFLSASPMR